MPFGQVRDTRTLFTASISAFLAHFESIGGFIAALFLVFMFNLIADLGLKRRDGTNGIVWHKIRSSICEFILIFSIILFLKILVDLMQQSDKSAMLVECLVWVALYIYLKNAFESLSISYPNVYILKFISNILSFIFRRFAPDIVKDSFEGEKEKEEEKENEDNK